MSIPVFCSCFQSGYLCFGVLGFINSFYIVDTNPLSDMPFANIFSHSIGCLLVLLMVSIPVQKVFILMKSQCFIFAFVSLASGDISRKKLLQRMSKRLLPVFSSRILMVLGRTFRPLIHFELILIF